MIVFASHNILDKGHLANFALLKCIRYYLVMDMYAALDVHTSETIRAGCQSVLEFSDALQVS
jgi:hypothetical protein